MSKDGNTTVLMQRGNCQITVFDFEVKEYTEKGYSLVSPKAETPKKSRMSPEMMEERIVSLEKTVSALQQTVNELTKKTTLTRTVKKTNNSRKEPSETA